ncbi:hypothetical protein HPB47_001414 [Ixodes persulcatus]|uniref:Uncharacterized protein n=1 Tax=Ixodes persulcatus TaxID=34615 RepID=A0AC60PP27_IXOPE|nr:hypothetical protein HPB47_001414 [Ixodes persulcatus]
MPSPASSTSANRNAPYAVMACKACPKRALPSVNRRKQGTPTTERKSKLPSRGRKDLPSRSTTNRPRSRSQSNRPLSQLRGHSSSRSRSCTPNTPRLRGALPSAQEQHEPSQPTYGDCQNSSTVVLQGAAPTRRRGAHVPQGPNKQHPSDDAMLPLEEGFSD